MDGCVGIHPPALSLEQDRTRADDALSEIGEGLPAVERAMGIEPTTSSLGSLRSTTELRPRDL
jgi:hypothetical protein